MIAKVRLSPLDSFGRLVKYECAADQGIRSLMNIISARNARLSACFLNYELTEVTKRRSFDPI